MEHYDYNKAFDASRMAARWLTDKTDYELSSVICTLADLLEENAGELLDANQDDLARMDRNNPLYDRLKLTPDRIAGIAGDLRNVASLPSPVGETVEERTLPNGIELRKVRVPFGVIGVIYEARPNVTFDVFALCLKSGNASVLKGGADASASNRAAIGIIHQALRKHGFPADCCTLLPSTHEATAAMLGAVGKIDVCIPRGGRRLIDFVRDNARVPVIETGAGVVHMYFHASGDTSIGARCIGNAKTRRVSVCNALDTLLIDKSRLADLTELVAPLAAKNVTLHLDDAAFVALKGKYPSALMVKAIPDDWNREWMDYKMGVRTVSGIGEALDHIAAHGSGHSESIIADDQEACERFRREADASCVYVNLPTSFTDGAQFGLGAEIGISTQKLGPRGPMGLREITTTRYLLTGNGQVRP